MRLTDRCYFGGVLKRKAAEFHKSGYPQVTTEELWVYCQEYLWPKRQALTHKTQKRLLALITPHDFFDYQQIKIRTHQNSLSELGDLSDLF